MLFTTTCVSTRPQAGLCKLVLNCNFQVTVLSSLYIICKQLLASWPKKLTDSFLGSTQSSTLSRIGDEYVVAYGLQDEGLLLLIELVTSILSLRCSLGQNFADTGNG